MELQLIWTSKIAHLISYNDYSKWAGLAFRLQRYSASLILVIYGSLEHSLNITSILSQSISVGSIWNTYCGVG